jgi:group I intron endonuclease
MAVEVHPDVAYVMLTEQQIKRKVKQMAKQLDKLYEAQFERKIAEDKQIEENHKKYIGQSIDIYHRWKDHKRELNGNRHHNEYLQRAWNKYKEENFEFIVLEDCEVDELSEREKYYIKLYKDMDLAYNIHDGGDEGYNLGKHLSEETKRKIGEKNRINGLGRKASDETKEKMSKSHAVMKYTPMSEEGRKNIQQAQQKYFENNPKKLCVDDVIEIRKLHRDGLNYSEIARKYNVTPQCINDICNYKRWKQVH